MQLFPALLVCLFLIMARTSPTHFESSTEVNKENESSLIDTFDKPKSLENSPPLSSNILSATNITEENESSNSAKSRKEDTHTIHSGIMDSDIVNIPIKPQNIRNGIRSDVSPLLFLAAFVICGFFLALCGYKRLNGMYAHALTTKGPHGENDAIKGLYTSVQATDGDEEAEDWDEWEADDKILDVSANETSHELQITMENLSDQPVTRPHRILSSEIAAHGEEKEKEETCDTNRQRDIFKELDMHPNIRYAQPVSQMKVASHPKASFTTLRLDDGDDEVDADIGAAWESDDGWVEGL